MSPENTQRLCHDFPQLYDADFPFCCGDGWMDLLYGLSRALVDHAEQAGLRLIITDIKEKHGSLRFYVEGTDEEADRLIAMAEDASETMAEETR